MSGPDAVHFREGRTFAAIRARPMGHSVPRRRTDAAATTRVALPNYIVVVVLVLTFLPTVLNFFGVDFSTVGHPGPATGNSLSSAVEPNRQSRESAVGEHVHTLLEWSAVAPPRSPSCSLSRTLSYQARRDDTDYRHGAVLLRDARRLSHVGRRRFDYDRGQGRAVHSVHVGHFTRCECDLHCIWRTLRFCRRIEPPSIAPDGGECCSSFWSEPSSR